MSQIKALNGYVIAVTTQSDPKGLRIPKKDWHVDMEILSDPQNSIAIEFSKRDWIHIVLSQSKHYAPNLMAQPGVLILPSNTDKPIYNWAVNPTLMNLGGASDRPVFSHVWRDARTYLEAPRDQNATEGMHLNLNAQRYKTRGVCSICTVL